jgi:hypothetical protein
LIQNVTTGERLDVAICAAARSGKSMEVRRIFRLGTRRVTFVPHHGFVILAPAGSFERWALAVGDTLAVEGSEA